ncbi:MAG: hypothetical protein RIT04_701 [Candidatus Parcubacteria bacterium]
MTGSKIWCKINLMEKISTDIINQPESSQEQDISPVEDINEADILYKNAQIKLSEYNEKLKSGTGDVRYLKQEIQYLTAEIYNLAPHVGIPDREEWRGKDPFVFRENNVIKLKELVKNWHDYKPDYIFLTETSAIPYGYAIKEAWKIAYPNEEIPIFYRIESWTEQAHIVEIDRKDDIDNLIRYSNPQDSKLPLLKKMKEGITDYLVDRIKKDNAKILIFDQYDKGLTPSPINRHNDGGQTISGLAHELKKNFPRTTLFYAGVNSHGRKLDFGRSGYPINKQHPRVTLKRNVNHDNKKLSDEGNRIDAMAKRPSDEIIQDILTNGYNPTGMTIKDPERRKEALEYIKSLKEIGAIAGNDLFAELKK